MKTANVLIVFMTILLAAALSGCHKPAPAPEKPVKKQTGAKPTPSKPAPEVKKQTEQEPVVDGCRVDPASISFSNEEGRYMSAAEVGEELVTRLLEAYKGNAVCARNRLRDFRINSVAPMTQEKNTFIFKIDFDVQVENLEENDWMRETGRQDVDNWIRYKVAVLNAEQKNNTYRITALSPEM